MNFSLAVVDSREAGTRAAFPVDVELAVVVKLDDFSREEAELIEVSFGETHDLLLRRGVTKKNTEVQDVPFASEMMFGEALIQLFHLTLIAMRSYSRANDDDRREESQKC